MGFTGKMKILQALTILFSYSDKELCLVELQFRISKLPSNSGHSHDIVTSTPCPHMMSGHCAKAISLGYPE